MIPIPIPDPPTPDRYGIGALNIRTASGEEPAPGGGVVPVGRVTVSITPQQWAGDVYVRALAPLVIPDAAAWLADLTGAEDPLAAAAAQKFTDVQAGLLWLTRLRMSQDGLCDRPAE